VPQYLHKSLNLNPRELKYFGPTTLLQFDVENFAIEVINNGTTGNTQHKNIVICLGGGRGLGVRERKVEPLEML
jgi:hypothetical protein